MSKNTMRALFLLAIMIGYPIYTEGLVRGLFLFFQLYTVILSMSLAGWLMYRLAMGTWSLENVFKNAKKLRSPEEESEYSSESDRFFGMKLFMIVGAAVALIGLVIKIILDLK